MSTAIKQRFDALRKKLIDTSMRNRMLNFRMPRTHGVQVAGEDSLLVFERLVNNEREMSFDGQPDPPNQKSLADGEINYFDDEFSQAQFRDAALEELEAISTLPIPPTSQTDSKLNTNYEVSHLAARLLKTFRDARLVQDETGVNMLYLAFGGLRWREAEDSDVERVAPLVFVPVELKQLKNGMFKVACDGGNIQDNLALVEKLHEQSIDLPRFQDGGDLAAYLNEVRGTVSHRKDWYVEVDWITLSFFQFTKIAMYLDLDEALWPEGQKPSADVDICAMLGDGYAEVDIGIDEGAFIDDHRPVDSTIEVLNCDASQALAILRAQAGQSMVIEGPPGTGKSQTIVNLIAEFVGQGKSVLFVSEKMAALDVVDRQLARVGLGDVVMKLHSKESKRREFYEELKRVINLNKTMRNVSAQIEQYSALRDKLNAYCKDINTPVVPWNLTPHAAIGFASALPSERTEDIEHRVPFEGIRDLTWDALASKRNLIESYQSLLPEGIALAQHTWYGVGFSLITPGNRIVIEQAITNGISALSEALPVIGALAQEMAAPEPVGILEFELLAAGARAAIVSPEANALAYDDAMWDQGIVLDVLNDIETEQGCRARFEPNYASAQLKEIDASVSALTHWQSRWWRLLSSEYRNAARFIRALDLSAKSVGAMRIAAEEISRGRHAGERISNASEIMAGLFKSHWKGIDSDAKQLKEILAFVVHVRAQVVGGKLHQSLLSRFIKGVDRDSISSSLEKADIAMKAAVDAINNIYEKLEYRFAAEGFANFNSTLDRLREWERSTESIHSICQVNLAEAALRDAGLGGVVDAAQDWKDANSRLVGSVLRSYFEGVLSEAYSQRTALAHFNRETHSRDIEEFRQLDDLMFKINSGRVRLSHLQAIPSQTVSIGNVGDLFRQMQLKRGHKPIRWALDRLGDYILQIKPLFMMSPLSVSQFLPRSGMRFDVLIFDEASQVRPEDALAAITRSEQVIVVGDDKQLPPTSFFEKMTGGDLIEDDEGIQGVQDQESVLGLMTGACQLGKRITDLRYHYRSLHPNLIRVSNTEFYQDRLIVFPSSGAEDARGLVFHHEPDDRYDRGRTRSNRSQARRVIDRVFRHMREEPERSLGIVAFSEAQQQALSAEFDLRMRHEPDVLERFNAGHPFEMLFIKNLETVQGDERDVIYISVGYGPDEHGKFNMAFGPINAEGGERRLNVLMTRAKRRCEVFSSFSAGDMRTLENPSRGLAVLKRFLQFAQTGELDDPRPTDRPTDSPFEEQVGERLRSLGHEVHHQVGSIGYAIDLAIVNPNKPGSYALAIECDGARYHSARSARDRDKIRQMALESRGWKIHRIWSTDWWQSPTKVIERCSEAIAAALVDERPAPPRSVSVATEEMLIDVETTRHHGEPYTVWRPDQGVIDTDFYSCPVNRLADMIAEIVAAEGPVHEDVILRRICAAFALARAGSRVQDMVRSALNAVVVSKKVRREESFLHSLVSKPAPRNRGELPAEERRADWVADSELAEAIRKVATEARGAKRDEIAASSWRLLGFSRVSEAMTNRSLLLIERLIEVGQLTEKGELLHGMSPPDD